MAPTSSFIAEPKVFGREDVKKKIVEFLLTQARDCEFLLVYPIVGLGGIGKTTLAQLVYNDVRVSSNFDTKIWICVSEAFSIKRILCSIIESITGGKCDVLDLDVLLRKVKELLKGKRYFMVLDDVWNKTQQLAFGLSQEKWNTLKSVFKCGSKGSSILVSTRDEVVAAIMGTCQAYPLHGLSDNEWWLLFKQYAFGNDKEEREELLIGKDIVKKCGGLPLAAQALGGLMRSRSGENEWLEVKESKLWDLEQENSILLSLRLSYFYLTPTLKRCFAFCCMFPKDTKIKKETLIHLWMANGFISSRENLEVEDVGSMIWNELCQKSFFQDIEMNDYSADISFKMHDLAQSIMGQECMYLENANMTSLSKSTHHICFHSDDLLSLNEGAFKKVESLRTLFQLDHNRPKHDHLPTNRSLRVLCTSSLQVPSLESLIHLQYLELRSSNINILPDSICNLQKLEILNVKHCRLSCLPKGLSCLQNYRHLIIDDADLLSKLFPCIRKLTSLRTLSLYIVSLEGGNSLVELGNLNLGGKLSIKGLKDVGSLSEAQEANLIGKKDLQELCLSWESNDEFTKTHIVSAEQLLEVLQPHSNLKCLKITYYDGILLPSWISILSNLVYVALSNCDNCVRLSSFGKLQSLKFLELSYMKNLKYLVEDDESHDDMEVTIFPSLEFLILRQLPNLESLLKVERGEVFPCLSRLVTFFCPKLRLPCLPSLKDLNVQGCNVKLLNSISSLCGLTHLILSVGDGLTFFPEGMFKNLTCLQSLLIHHFPKLKELPNEPFSLDLEDLSILSCGELESLPEQIWEGLQSLQTMKIGYCEGLRCLPEGIRHLTSLEFLNIYDSPTLEERCKEGIKLKY